jgi:ABC-2 type transport system ATP-binding protein
VSAVLDADKLGRWYGQVVGLSELTLALEGGINGLLGPNGAGKSTFLKLVAGEIRPSRGSLRVLDCVPFANRDYFRRVGFCPQQDALYDDLDAVEFVSFLMRLHGFAAAEAKRRAHDALDRVGLVDGRERRCAGYSKGMRQRAKLAQAIAHEPELLVVDEPLNGLDPVGRVDMVALFGELAAHGTHVLISSHVLHEVESLTKNIVLLHRGRLLAQGTVAEVRQLLSRHPRRVEIRARDPRALARRVVEFSEVSSIRLGAGDGRLSIETRDLDAFLQRLTAAAAQERAGIASLESTDASLDAVFDYLVS